VPAGRLQIDHVSRYDYSGVVHSSYNEVRLTTLSTPCQQLLDLRVDVTPRALIYTYIDYWGSQVHAFDIQASHNTLTVVARSLVESFGQRCETRDLGWDAFDSDDVGDRFSEFLQPTTYVPADERLRFIGAELASSAPPYAAAIDAIKWVGESLIYRSGTTGVHTSAIEAWDGGSGVCQDFAHLSLALLRSMGVPARYCSGYVYPDGDHGLGERVSGESHAWVEYWIGEWVAVDPTAGRPVDASHVLVARGRDYADVVPLKGIFHGGPTSAMQVEVHLTRLS
jgi:transglutaminase-like putative cysteine protease